MDDRDFAGLGALENPVHDRRYCGLGFALFRSER
jgi:hypothetical protein